MLLEKYLCFFWNSVTVYSWWYHSLEWVTTNNEIIVLTSLHSTCRGIKNRLKTKNNLLWTCVIVQTICATEFQRMSRSICATVFWRFWEVQYGLIYNATVLISRAKESWCSIQKEEYREYIRNRNKHWVAQGHDTCPLYCWKGLRKKVDYVWRNWVMEGIENLTVCILLKTQIYKSIVGLIFETLFSKKL